ncbi:MAG: hypothetical protein Q8N94_02280 [Methanoregula sp.]|nr:hypothetical protein [Methanoregula sp.]
MIHKGIEQLKTLAKEGFAALKEKCAAVIRWITSAPSVAHGAKKILVAADGNVLDMGKRYRLTSGHAPHFSLYTFFNHR